MSSGLLGCPPGKESVVTSEPCPTGEIHDGDACVPEGCGVGRWGGLPVGDDTVFVDISSAPGGDGSDAAPLTSIQAAVDLAGERGGGLVAVAAGEYAEAIAMGDGHGGVDLEGRCRELVTLDGSTGEYVPAVELVGETASPAVELGGLTIRAGRHGGLWVQGASVAVHATDLRANIGVGVLAWGGTAAIEDVGVYDTLPDDYGDYGRGIIAQGGGLVSAIGCTVERNTEIGVIASDEGSRIDLVDSLVLDTAPPTHGEGGAGVVVQAGAALTMSGCAVRGNTRGGVVVGQAGSEILLEDSEISDNGSGVSGQYGSQMTVRGCAIEGNAVVGVDVRDPGTSALLETTEVLDTRPDEDGRYGRGVQVAGGAELIATDSTLRGNTEMGIYVVEDDSRATLTRCDVLEARPGAAGDDGLGVWVERGGRLDCEDCLIEGNTNIGVFVANAGTVVSLVDTRVLATRLGRVIGVGAGVLAQDDALFQQEGGEISGTSGVGIGIVSGARAELNSTVLAGNTFAGVVVLRGTVVLVGSEIRDTQPSASAGGGLGVYANGEFGAPTVTLRDSTIGPHPYAAVWLDGTGVYDLDGDILSGSGGVLLQGWPAHGNAVFAHHGVGAWDGTTGLRIANSSFTDAAMVSVVLDGAGAALEGNSWSGNTLDVLQQRCTAGTVPLSDEMLQGVPAWQRCPDGNRLFDDSVHFDTFYLPDVDIE